MSTNVKYCESCGGKNKKKAKFCDDCGKPFDKSEKTTEAKPSRLEGGSGLEVISLVTSILGFTCLPVIGLIIAIVTGLLSPNPKENKYAKTGVTIGSFGLIVPVLVMSIVGIVFSIIEAGDLHDDFMWVPILSVIGLILSGVGLFFYIKWIRIPANK